MLSAAATAMDSSPKRLPGSGQSALTNCRFLCGLCHSDMVCFICRHLMQRVITINLEVISVLFPNNDIRLMCMGEGKSGCVELL